MTQTLGNLALIFVFILIGGVFAAAEMALVSLRDSQVKQLASKGKRGAAIEHLIRNPNRFLSAVQIGVTLAGFLSASFGGATLADDLAPVLARTGLPMSVASPLALVLITIIISYFSIVLSELTAKRLAMQRAEGFALALGPMVNGIATAARPLIWFLGKSTDVVVRILGGDPKASKEEVSDEEIRSMVSSSQTLGDEERLILDEVFDAGERSLREVMVPRTEVDFLSGDMPAHRAMREVQGAPHSRYPVTDGSTDRIAGFLHVRDLFDLDPQVRQLPVKQLVRPVLSLPETVKVLRALTDMRREGAHLAIVLDEWGGTAGIVTLEDLMEELIGDITDEYDVVDDQRAHSELSDVDGLTTLEEFEEATGYVLEEGPYDTVAGWVMAQLGHVPQVGDQVEVELVRSFEASHDLPESALVVFEVAELDGRRAAWLRVHRADGRPSETDPGDATEAGETTEPDVASTTEREPAEAGTGDASS
ncbi:hemolysin family protein [Aestuariimicrobium ganziense]|uniref:hemolysin family protein n=1 Tax=Aestuariimicrobium ganziense TaxID=2773677 RepID=UPI00194329E0|nr:hemolysin family protein [Aestuariimicrobium ganziense]